MDGLEVAVSAAVAGTGTARAARTAQARKHNASNGR